MYWWAKDSIKLKQWPRFKLKWAKHIKADQKLTKRADLEWVLLPFITAQVEQWWKSLSLLEADTMEIEVLHRPKTQRAILASLTIICLNSSKLVDQVSWANTKTKCIWILRTGEGQLVPRRAALNSSTSSINKALESINIMVEEELSALQIYPKAPM